jgi:ABC-type multidrug transport system fused ATPase/permease subunit
VVLQDAYLQTPFSYALNNQITKKMFWPAKEMQVHIMNLPDNYDFDVKERGVVVFWTTSIDCLLRAYVSNLSILILDEATSSIDSYSEELIQRATETITQGRTQL